jgi:hypothetical protein
MDGDCKRAIESLIFRLALKKLPLHHWCGGNLFLAVCFSKLPRYIHYLYRWIMKKKSKQADAQLDLFSTDLVSETKQHNKKKTADRYTFDLLDALRAPVITSSQMWADSIPERLLKELPAERLIAYKKGEQMATYLECSIYLYTASLEAPMTHDWATITCHVSCKVLEDLFGEDRWEIVDAPKVLDDYRMSKLNELRHMIYTKRRELLKKRMKNRREDQS